MPATPWPASRLDVGKTWDQAFAALDQAYRANLASFWYRAGHGRAGAAEMEAAWGERAWAEWGETPAPADLSLDPDPVPPVQSISKVPTIGGRKPINSHYAGDVHPSGVQFKEDGFPDFEPHAKAKVELEGLTGNNKIDARKANNAAGFPATPSGYRWRHVEDGKTMLLVPKELHDPTGHSGGVAVIRNGGLDQ